jgi:hypothetical protein
MATGNDMKAAEATYAGFITLIKWSMAIIVPLTALVIFLISA